MNVRQSKWLFLFFPLFFSNQVFAKIPVHLFIGLSGGYGQNSDAYENTGTDGAIRFDFGSILPINSFFVIGDQIGFQTGSQIRLNNQLTSPIGSGIVPVLLNTKTPIDFLLFGRYVLHEPLFFQAKGGAVFISSTVTGADVQTKNTILPEVQAGIGFNAYKRSRVTLSYQQFFGNTPIISSLAPNQGTYQVKGIPVWRGALLTFEHDL
ncbi:MAG: hypothetical protein KBB94_02460 [Legionellaceae bacterium]|nr:hypothetical protein [Legionellaceae bacterium]MBP9775085.1 hypothetical protein [Legionellaceae bacterium]